MIKINQKHKKNKNEHIDEILGEIRHRIMIEIWSIIPTGLLISHLLAANFDFTFFFTLALLKFFTA